MQSHEIPYKNLNNFAARSSNNALLERIVEHWFTDIKRIEAIDALLEFFPLQVFDENEVKYMYEDVSSAFDQELVQFAVKANPSVLPVLHRLGCEFEVASAGEIGLCMQHGIDVSKVLYTNPSRSWLENKYAIKAGIVRFVCHDKDGLKNLEKGIKLAQECSEDNNCLPGEEGYVPPDYTPDLILRIYVDKQQGIQATGQGITRLRFGRNPDKALELLEEAHRMGFNAIGVSFHVGSDEKNPLVWKKPIEDSAYIFKEFLNRTGKELKEIDIGGGLPFQRTGVKTHQTFADSIREYTNQAFEAHDHPYPELSLEPGRALVSSAGVIFTRIIDVIPRKMTDEDGKETILNVITENGGRINSGIVPFGYDAYAFRFDNKKGFIDLDGNATQAARTFGETCTDFDCSGDFVLPAAIDHGDNLVFLGTGVYVDAFKSDLCSLEPPFIVRVNEGDPFPNFNVLTKLLSDHLLPLKEKHHLLQKELNDLMTQFHEAC